jgi:hypothetical protein
MPVQAINDVHLYYESAGRGEPLVPVHGSWVDHNEWAAVAALLSQSFQRRKRPLARRVYS